MKEIIIASNNKGKINRVKELLKEYKIVSLKELGIEIDKDKNNIVKSL